MNLFNQTKGLKTYWGAALLLLVSIFGVANNLFTQQQIEAGIGIFLAYFAASFRSAMKTETEKKIEAINNAATILPEKEIQLPTDNAVIQTQAAEMAKTMVVDLFEKITETIKKDTVTPSTN